MDARGIGIGAVVAVAVMVAWTPPATAAFSLGAVLGDPTGFTLRGDLSGRAAIQGHVGFGFFPGDAVIASADFTFDAYDFLKGNRTASLWFFMGLGPKFQWFTGRYFAYGRSRRSPIEDGAHFGFGARGVAGIRAVFREAPFDVFFELAPVGITVVVPDPGAFYDVDVAFGFRYRF